MHAEWMKIPSALSDEIAEARRRGARVVAVGTTVVRASKRRRTRSDRASSFPWKGETRMLIQPGHRFRVVDALLTNFHLPRSTLLALVSAFAGCERILEAYRQAVLRGYRFFSYGDAMWIERRDREATK